MDTSTDRAQILVTAGSKHGATLEIAERIGETLQRHGHQVEVTPAERVDDIDGYQVVVLGSAVYAGHWVASAREVADMIANSATSPTTWIFSSGPIGDPPKPEEEAVDVTEVIASTTARDHRVFSGKIDKSSLSFAERAILVAVRAPEGDFRDWDDIENWANEIARQLAKEDVKS
jgi:menaquinone-dependent protoporphyrinogen oxidase